MTVPGIGPIISSAVVAAIGTGSGFKQGRDFAACPWGTPLTKSAPYKRHLHRQGQATEMRTRDPQAEVYLINMVARKQTHKLD